MRIVEADLDLGTPKALGWGQAGGWVGYIIRQMSGDDEVGVSMLDHGHDAPVNAANFYALWKRLCVLHFRFSRSPATVITLEVDRGLGRQLPAGTDERRDLSAAGR
jgi:hypothetical protein